MEDVLEWIGKMEEKAKNGQLKRKPNTHSMV